MMMGLLWWIELGYRMWGSHRWFGVSARRIWMVWANVSYWLLVGSLFFAGEVGTGNLRGTSPSRELMVEHAINIMIRLNMKHPI